MAENVSDESAHIADNNIDDIHDKPPSPVPNDEADTSTESKSSRKREREVSQEPATPKPDDTASGEVHERRIPVTKKNRVVLGPTAEEDETPPNSPRLLAELSTSPPHETKVRQISMRVRGLKWEDKPGQEAFQEVDDVRDTPSLSEGGAGAVPAEQTTTDAHSEPSSPNDVGTQNGQPLESIALPSQTGGQVESDSEDQDKILKRKLGDTVASAIADRPSSKYGMELAKRARDDAEEDDNPREKKRPSPPPEEKPTEPDTTAQTAPIGGGFLAYASTSSPFAQTRGPSIFGKPSASPFASVSKNKEAPVLSGGGDTSPTASSFAGGNGSKTLKPTSSFSSLGESSTSKDVMTTTGTKRTGFEAFASSTSPFASAARSKSPTGFSRGQAAIGNSLARSKSPPRRNVLANASAFKPYSDGGSQAFVVPDPPVKKQRHDAGSGSSSETGENERAAFGATSTAKALNGGSPEGSEEESDRQTTFGERLRAGKDDSENAPAASDDEDTRLSVTEREVRTGEEHEETIFQVRGKLYALSDQSAWKERGTGLLKLNVRKSDGGGARLVMRKEAVFTLLLNVTLFRGMRCNFAQDPRYVRFSCIERGHTVHYNVRLANAKVASELLEEINANIPGDEHV